MHSKAYPESVLVILIGEEGKKVKLFRWSIQKDPVPVFGQVNKTLDKF